MSGHHPWSEIKHKRETEMRDLVDRLARTALAEKITARLARSAAAKYLIRSVLTGIREAGARIVVTDPNTEPGERPVIVKEWKP